MKGLASYIDHTNLKPDATETEIKRLCREAREFGFASVCVNGSRVALAARELKGSSVAVCCVVGFPLGAAESGVKAFEARRAASFGASEIDMVMNIGYIKDGSADAAERDVRAVAEAVPRCVVKAIIEACLLTNEEKVMACLAAERGGARFVKTSTGFSTGGATVEDVKLMRETLSPATKIKAAGGIRDCRFALRLIEAGADRIGASKSVEICANCR